MKNKEERLYKSVFLYTFVRKFILHAYFHKRMTCVDYYLEYDISIDFLRFVYEESGKIE